MATCKAMASAAKRIRERRLRSWLRHERMSIACALAEATQHSSRGQETARAGEAPNCKPKSDVAVGTEFFLLFDEEDSAGTRPPPLVEVRPLLLEMVHAACPCTVLPSLELPALGGGSDAVDSSALVFLVCRAVEDRRRG